MITVIKRSQSYGGQRGNLKNRSLCPLRDRFTRTKTNGQTFVNLVFKWIILNKNSNREFEAIILIFILAMFSQ